MLTGLELILIGTIVLFIVMLIVVLVVAMSKMNQMMSLVTQQANHLQTGIEQRIDKLQLRADPLMEEVQQKLQLIEKRGEPIMEETYKLIVSVRPTLEQLSALLEAARPVLLEAHATVQLAKESATLTRSAANTLKVEAESCMAAIRATTTELTKMTHEEAEGVRQLIAITRERAELQVMRVDQMVTRTTDRLDETATLVQTGVLKPVTEIAAVLAAAQRFLQVLFAQERKQIDEAYQDEEMFI